MNENENTQQYVYIVQASLEPSKCKIGKTNDLDRRLKEYNNMTGNLKENIYQYLFTCEIEDMFVVEKDIKENFGYLREEKSMEIYLYNTALLKMYTEFIGFHKLFIKEIFVKTEGKKQEIIKKTTPSLKERGFRRKIYCKKHKKQKMMNFTLGTKM